MANSSFHEEPYDAGTLTKLDIFELYVQEWIPVFVSRSEPPFEELHVFDFFCGPGTDAVGQAGSPLRILRQMRSYQPKMAGWSKVKIVAHFSDVNAKKIALLENLLQAPEWQIPGVQVKTKAAEFEAELIRHEKILLNPRAVKLLIIDQFGVDAVLEYVFRRFFTFPRTDFIFFVSSSTLHRFRDHPAIKIKIDHPETSYDVHRAAFDWYQKLTPPAAYLGRFSIKKGSNIYGLIFGSQHPLAATKFLNVAWRNDQIAGEANFDIDREGITPDEPLLPFAEFQPKKKQAFEADLETAIRTGKMKSEADLVHFCISAGMTCQHATPVLLKLQSEGVIACNFRTPDPRNLKTSRPILLC